MNALAGAYVSEVSSLPAYPCMVFVSHAERSSFRVTRYDGGTEVLSDPTELQLLIQRSHGELAAAIRRTEADGREFDPVVDFPEAIKRIDVKAPAPDMEESGAVLVDTPGLYSRMKFGYDRMTRDFRNAAACAVFVVKTDNVFLEQVFNEFSELLDLFSRIFLVLNIDSTKVDVGPSGELLPSVEQTEPRRIVEAFENFAMSAPLKKAADEGRLKIYPIDLLRSASKRLGRLEASSADDESESESSSSETPPGRSVSFERFQGDLTDFLNSTDYLTSFMHDSLSRADMLLEELEEVCGREALGRFLARLDSLQAERSEVGRRRDAIAQLERHDWEASMKAFRRHVSERTQENLRGLGVALQEEMDLALEGWFQSDASLQDLELELRPKFESRREQLVETALRDLTSGSALPLPEDIRLHLDTVGLQIDKLGRDALDHAGAAPLDGEPAASLSSEDVPVKKRLLDWLLLRRRATIQRKLFGPPGRPAQRISVQDKAARLGEEAKLEMRRALDRHRGEVFASTGDSIEQGMLQPHALALLDSMRKELSEQSQDLGERLDALQREIVTARRVQTKVDSLKQHIQAARTAIKDLHKEEPLLNEVDIVPAEHSAPSDAAEADADPAPESLEETVAAAFEAAIENPPAETAESEPAEDRPGRA
jgi:hypothetical protein